MELVDILIIVGVVVLILIFWLIVGARHLKYLKKEVESQWEIVDESIRRRHNLIPNLVETIRMYDQNQEKLVEQVINERIPAAREYSPGAKKIEYEHDLSKTIEKIIDFGKISEGISKDTNFLEIRKEIYDLENDIELKTAKYNEMVRYYNKHRNLFLLLPLSLVFGYKVMNIFEFEKK